MHLLFIVSLLLFLNNCGDSFVGKFDESLNQSLEEFRLIVPGKGSEQATSVTLGWEKLKEADSFQLQLSVDKEFKKNLIDSTVDTTRFTVAGLPGDTTIHWKVRPVINGYKTDWTEAWSFRTAVKPNGSPNNSLSAPKQISPNQGSQNISLKPTFKWEPVRGASAYIIHVSHKDQMVVEEKIKAPVHTYSEKFNPNARYYWRVRAVKDKIKGKWSEIMDFKTKPQNNEGTAESASTDRKALMELYKATNGDQWKNNNGWGTDGPLNSWYGIETNGSGRVTKIDLWKNNLVGKIEEVSWEQLNKVKELYLKGNHLKGSIPPSIGSMTDLEWLIIQGKTTAKRPSPTQRTYHRGKSRSNTNDFSGTIPKELGNLSNLKRLEISQAPNVTGPIPSELGNLSNLIGLYLNWNDFSGESIPASFGNLTNLEYLYMASSNLEGTIPASLKNLTQLYVLGLNYNKLTGAIPNLRAFTQLERLDLVSNNLTGKYPEYLNNGEFSQLKAVNLAWNNLTGEVTGFDKLQNLYFFDITGNNIRGPISAFTEVPAKIKLLAAGWNNLSGSFPQSGWPDFYQLKTFRFNTNEITGNIPCSFWEKLDNDNLNLVNIAENTLKDVCEEGAKNMVGRGPIKHLNLP